MKRLFLILTLCIVVLVGCSSKIDSWQENYDLGIRYLNEGNYAEAIIAFTAAIEIDEKNVAAYLGRAESYIGSGESAENLSYALKDYEKVADLDESVSAAYLGMANVYIRQGKYDKAIEILKKSSDIEKNMQVLSQIPEMGIEDASPEEVILEKISINSLPYKTSYYIGETIDTTGLTLNAQYSNGTAETINSGLVCSPIELTSTGTFAITISYNGKTASFDVTVEEQLVGVTWSFDNGVLTISGNGPMDDYEICDTPWYKYSEEISKVVIEHGITSIGHNAFAYCSSIETILIPSSVTSIGLSAFENCLALEAITIPSGITDISFKSFIGCSALKSITLPSSVTYIGGGAFSGCSSLKTLTMSPNVTYIGEGAFYDCHSIESIIIPACTTTIERLAFFGWTFNQIIYIKGKTSAPEGWDPDWIFGSSSQLLWNS